MLKLPYLIGFLCITRGIVAREHGETERALRTSSRFLQSPFTAILANQDYTGTQLAGNEERAYTYFIDGSQVSGVSVILDSTRGDADLYVFASVQAYTGGVSAPIAGSDFPGPMRDAVTVRNRIGTICIVVVGFDPGGSDFILQVQDSPLAASGPGTSPSPAPGRAWTGSGLRPSPSSTPSPRVRAPMSWTTTSSGSSLSSVAVLGILVGVTLVALAVAMFMRGRALVRKRARREQVAPLDAATGSAQASRASPTQSRRAITAIPAPAARIPLRPARSFRHEREAPAVAPMPVPMPMPVQVPAAVPTPVYQVAMYPPPGMVPYAPQPVVPGAAPAYPPASRATLTPPPTAVPYYYPQQQGPAQVLAGQGAGAAGSSGVTAEARLCAVCWDREKNTAFGCGHLACETCAASLATCHMCRAAVTARIRLYG